MRNGTHLRSLLRQIDGRGYGAYKDIAGGYLLEDGSQLWIDRVQGDPFAAPSRLRFRLPADRAKLPPWALSSRSRRTALADYLTRSFAAALATAPRPGRSASGKSGEIYIESPAQEVLERTSIMLFWEGEDTGVELRFAAGLPARGRRVLGHGAALLLLETIPSLVERSLPFSSLDGEALRRHLEVVEDQDALREQLPGLGLVAFVGDGAILPRRSGVDPRPLPQREGEVCIPFESPPSRAVELELPNAGRVRGMGIPEGVTLIVGGGYHGKSTLLQALQLGIYNHPQGDGRERVVTVAEGVKVRAEDGRRVTGVDLRPFIRNLPFGRDTAAFSSDDASGSTSQGANILEAVEVGARLLLMDEDTSATNFMVRDRRMQELVSPEQEPITPFLDKVRSLHGELGVSSILVVGGVGDYFSVADTVILMESYRPRDVTAETHAISERFGEDRLPEGGEGFGALTPRRPRPGSLDASRGRHREKIRSQGVRNLSFGRWEIDLTALEQLVERAQTHTLGRALLALRRHLDGETPLAEALDALEGEMEAQGLDFLTLGSPGGSAPDGGLAQLRRFEIAAALNRLRGLKVG